MSSSVQYVPNPTIEFLHATRISIDPYTKNETIFVCILVSFSGSRWPKITLKPGKQSSQMKNRRVVFLPT